MDMVVVCYPPEGAGVWSDACVVYCSFFEGVTRAVIADLCRL